MKKSEQINNQITQCLRNSDYQMALDLWEVMKLQVVKELRQEFKNK
jgi:hypothetical protein